MNRSLYLVAGLGKTGLSIARYLHRKNKDFIAFDTRQEAPGLAEFQIEFPKAQVFLQHVPHEIISQVTDVIASPGIPLETPCIAAAVQAGAEVYGDIECLAREIKAPVVAITGTNGKSTVTTLVGEMARKAGFKVAVAGNIGAPVLDILGDGHAYDLWVLELSSFQLDLTHSLKPIAATILNVTPDHLDRHHTLEAYINAKQSIYQHAKLALYNRDDVQTVPVLKSISSVSFGQDVPTIGNWGLLDQKGRTCLAKGSECLFPVDELLIKGKHNWQNALAAVALAEAAGIPIESIVQVLKSSVD